MKIRLKLINLLKKIYIRFSLKIKYIIADFDEKSKIITFVCYGTRAFFKKSLVDVPHDVQVISGLDSRQSCFLGIKVGQYIDIELDKFKKVSETTSTFYNAKKGIDLSFDRYGNVMFFDKKTGKPECLPAIDIVKNDQILKDFNPEASYAIGILVGKNIRNRCVEYLQDDSDNTETNVINIASAHQKKQ